MHVCGAERNGNVVLSLHAEDVHRPLPPGEVRQSGPGQQAAGQGNAVSRSEWFVLNLDSGAEVLDIARDNPMTRRSTLYDPLDLSDTLASCDLSNISCVLNPTFL